MRIENTDFSSPFSIFTPLPKLTDKQERLYVFRVIDSDKFTGINTMLYGLLLFELNITYDYAVGDHFIADWSGFNFNAMKTLEPTAIQKFIIIHQVNKFYCK